MVRKQSTAALLLLVGVLACGGKSTSSPGGPGGDVEIGDYCAEYPDDSFYCGGERFSPDHAFELVWADGGPPEGSVLVWIQSSPGGGLAPDGLLVASGLWRLVYVAPGGEAYDYLVQLDGIHLETYPAPRECEASDEVTIEDVIRQVRIATALLEESRGVVYEPGTFSLNFFRYAACFATYGRRATLVHSQTKNPTDLRYTVEFNSEHPEGTVCELDPRGCTQ